MGQQSDCSGLITITPCAVCASTRQCSMNTLTLIHALGPRLFDQLYLTGEGLRRLLALPGDTTISTESTEMLLNILRNGSPHPLKPPNSSPRTTATPTPKTPDS